MVCDLEGIGECVHRPDERFLKVTGPPVCQIFGTLKLLCRRCSAPAAGADGLAAITLRMRPYGGWPHLRILSGRIGVAPTARTLLSPVVFGPASGEAAPRSSTLSPSAVTAWSHQPAKVLFVICSQPLSEGRGPLRPWRAVRRQPGRERLTVAQRLGA